MGRGSASRRLQPGHCGMEAGGRRRARSRPIQRHGRARGGGAEVGPLGPRRRSRLGPRRRSRLGGGGGADSEEAAPEAATDGISRKGATGPSAASDPLCFPGRIPVIGSDPRARGQQGPRPAPRREQRAASRAGAAWPPQVSDGGLGPLGLGARPAPKVGRVAATLEPPCFGRCLRRRLGAVAPSFGSALLPGPLKFRRCALSGRIPVQEECDHARGVSYLLRVCRIYLLRVCRIGSDPGSDPAPLHL